MELVKVAKLQNGLIYCNKNESYKVLVKPVSRTFTNAKGKKPVYYVSVSSDGSQFRYYSGLFPTTKGNVFTADKKDSLGLKVLQKFEFSSDGEKLTIEKINKLSDI